MDLDDEAGAAARLAAVALVRCDGDGRVRWLNQAAARLLDVAVGAELGAAVDDDHREAWISYRAAFDGQTRQRRLETVLGSGTPVEILGSDDGSGTVTFVVYDLSDFRRQLRAAERAAATDQLTGLPNRRGFAEVGVAAWADVADAGRTPALLMIDLDDFKSFNDRHGHAVGDRLLAWVADSLLDVCGATDTPCRVGGDEFVVVCRDGGAARANDVHTDLARALGIGLVLDDGQRATVGASGGVASYVPETPFNRSLAEADIALFQAKRAGRGSVVVYGTDITDQHVSPATTVEELRLRADVDARTGLRRDHVFDRDLKRAAADAKLRNRSLALLLVDLDDFHEFNRHYHYDAGHLALRSVADVVVSSVRAQDRCYRYGGEEFVVILEGVDAAEAQLTAERIRSSVAELAIPHVGAARQILTVSVGVCASTSFAPVPPAWLMHGAAVAAFAAKDAGRNATSVSAPVDRAPAPRPRRPSALSKE